MVTSQRSNGSCTIDGNALRLTMSRIGLTHEGLQKAIGLTHKKSIENWCAGRSNPRYENARDLSQALRERGATVKELTTIGLPVLLEGDLQNQSGLTQAEIESALICVDKLVRHIPIASRYMDIGDHLRKLRQEVAILDDLGNPQGISELLKAQIKNLCITAEEFFTDRFCEDVDSGRFLYACSSLIDNGVEKYICDPGWMMLLYRMGRVARKPKTHVERVLFTRNQPMTKDEIRNLSLVVSRHLTQGVIVSLADQDKLPAELLRKRNMAYIDGKVLLHATDQVQWDLDLTDRRSDIDDAAERHEAFQRSVLLRFKPHDIDDVESKLYTTWPNKTEEE